MIEIVRANLEGRPIHIALTPGKVHDSMMAEELSAHARGRALIADTGYDADRRA